MTNGPERKEKVVCPPTRELKMSNMASPSEQKNVYAALRSDESDTGSEASNEGTYPPAKSLEKFNQKYCE